MRTFTTNRGHPEDIWRGWNSVGLARGGLDVRPRSVPVPSAAFAAGRVPFPPGVHVTEELRLSDNEAGLPSMIPQACVCGAGARGGVYCVREGFGKRAGWALAES